jgi:hypothetical protein
MGAVAMDVFAPGKTYKCRIRIAKHGRFNIGLGMASQNIVRSNKFKYTDWSKPGHGNYVNFSNGDIISHSDETMNRKSEACRFKESDVVEMEFDMAVMALRFCCNGQQSSFTVVSPQKGDRYRFVVYSPNIGDTVELLRSE